MTRQFVGCLTSVLLREEEGATYTNKTTRLFPRMVIMLADARGRSEEHGRMTCYLEQHRGVQTYHHHRHHHHYYPQVIN